jgi:DNA-binding response OmpR family regulator
LTVTSGDTELHLTATELKLLLEFVRRPGQVMSRQTLLKKVWDYGYVGDSRIVDAAVARLRAKVERDPANPVLLRTVRGIGYRLTKP